MAHAEDRHIQDKAPPSHENAEEVKHSFRVADAETTLDAKLAQRYNEMNYFQKYIMELIFMFFMFTFMVLTVPRTEVFLQKACRLNLHFNESVCDNITDDTNAAYVNQVERVAKQFGLIKDVASTIPAAISSVIAGQYMSRYGSKVPMVIALIGSILSSVVEMYTFLDMDSPLYWSILATIPQAATGGIMVFMTAVYANITVACPTEKRKHRFLMIQFFMFLPVVIAMAVGGPVYQQHGIIPLMAGLFFCFVIPFILLVFFFKDKEISESAKKDSCIEAWKYASSSTTFKQSLSYLPRKRPGHARAQLFCMLCCIVIAPMEFSSSGDLNQIYMKHLFKWDSKKFSFVNTLVMVIRFVLVIPLMMVMTKVFNFSDPMMFSLGFASVIAKFSLLSVMFIGGFLYIVQGIVTLPFMVGLTALRSHTSRLLESHEVEVIFALTSVGERITPLIADIMGTAIYNATNDSFAGLVYSVQGFIFVIPLGLAILCLIWNKREGYPTYKKLIEENDDSVET